jgi:NACHT domain
VGGLRIKIVWLLAGASCAIIAAGLALYWHWQGQALGISVGLPVAATLVTPIVSLLFAAPLQAGRSTTEHLQMAAQVLVDSGLEQWRVATVTQPALRGGDATLNVPWMISRPGAMTDTAERMASDVTSIAMELREHRPCRLIVVGPAGSGKTTLARLVMVELLKQARPQDRVPVFLSLSAWNPRNQCLNDWIKRRIDEEVPEIRDKSSYGPTASLGLIERHMILPIIDGLDVLSCEFRRSLLTSTDFDLHDQVIVTCREEEFHEVADACATSGAVTITPGRVSREEMARYLRAVTDRPQRWDGLLDRLEQVPNLTEALSHPRTVFLVSTIYRQGESNPSELIAAEDKSHHTDIEEYLLRKLIPALIPAGVMSASGYPWYSDRAARWLAFLTRPQHGPTEGSDGDIAWWRLYRAVPYLARVQVPLRALLYGVAAWLAVSLLMPGRYGELTGLAYSSAIAAGCLFLAHPRDRDVPKPFSRPAWRWWVRRAYVRSWRFLAAGVTTFLGFGFFIGLRVALTGSLGSGVRTGAADGAVAGMVVVLAAVIAGIPTPPRADSSVNAHSTVRPKATPITIALGLGTTFGLLAGFLAVIKHQHVNGPSLKQGLIYGLIVGLDFGVGTWLVRRTETFFSPGNAPDPPSGLRAERSVALLVPVILGLTFASAFGLNARLHWDYVGGITNGLVGLIVGSLASDWPIYMVAVGLLAVTRQLPIRVMKFLEYCHRQGIVRPVLQSYRFCEDPRRIGLDAGSGIDLEPLQIHDADYTLAAH